MKINLSHQDLTNYHVSNIFQGLGIQNYIHLHFLIHFFCLFL